MAQVLASGEQRMSEISVHKVLVSACLLGQPVRYDGQSKGSSATGCASWG